MRFRIPALVGVLVTMANCSSEISKDSGSQVPFNVVEECTVKSVSDCGGYTPVADATNVNLLKTAWPKMCSYPYVFPLPTADGSQVLACGIRVCHHGSCNGPIENEAEAEFASVFGAQAMDDMIQAGPQADLIRPYSGMIGVSGVVLFIKRPGGFTGYYRKSQIAPLLQHHALDTAFDAFNRKSLHLYHGTYLGSKFWKGEGVYQLRTGSSCNVANGAKQFVEFSVDVAGAVSYKIQTDTTAEPYNCPIE